MERSPLCRRSRHSTIPNVGGYFRSNPAPGTPMKDEVRTIEGTDAKEDASVCTGGSSCHGRGRAAGTATCPCSDKKPIRLEGRVVGLNGAPVRKANVHLQGSGAAVPVQNGQASTGYLQTTDETGKFIFDNVAPGRYTLGADKIGFLAARYGARTEGGPAVPLILAAGDEKKNLEIKMTSQGVIMGRVIDQDGDPIANAQITVARYGYIGGRRALFPASAGLSAWGTREQTRIRPRK